MPNKTRLVSLLNGFAGGLGGRCNIFTVWWRVNITNTLPHYQVHKVLPQQIMNIVEFSTNNEALSLHSLSVCSQ